MSVSQTLTAKQVARLTQETALRLVAELRDAIRAADGELEELHRRRAQLLAYLRTGFDRPLSQRKLGPYAGLSDVGVLSAVRKYQEREAAGP